MDLLCSLKLLPSTSHSVSHSGGAGITVFAWAGG